MLRRLPLLAVLVPLWARAGDDPKRFHEVNAWKGTFSLVAEIDFTQGSAHVEDKRRLLQGTIVLEHHTSDPGGDYWTGSATAYGNFLVKSDTTTPQGSISISTVVEGKLSGMAELDVISKAPVRHQLRVRFPAMKAVQRTRGFGIDRAVPAGIGYSTGTTFLNGDLPAEGLELDARRQQSGGGPQPAILETWHLTPDETLVAVPSIAAVERGKPSHLDGSRSKGYITRYTWKLEPKKGDPATGACPDDAPRGTIETAEKMVDVTLLCSMDATLTVSDSSRSSKPKTAVAKIRPRDWRTKPNHTEGEGKLGIGLDPAHSHYGTGICSIGHGDKKVGHVFHRGDGSDPATWEHQAYELGHVIDERSPFKGWTYVSQNKCRISRRTLLNDHLFPGSKMETKNKAEPYATQYKRLVASVKRHELIHTRLFQLHMVDANDPAPILERLMGSSDNPVRVSSDEAVSNAENWFSIDHYDELEREAREMLCDEGYKDTVIVRFPPDYEALPVGPLCDIGH